MQKHTLHYSQVDFSFDTALLPHWHVSSVLHPNQLQYLACVWWEEVLRAGMGDGDLHTWSYPHCNPGLNMDLPRHGVTSLLRCCWQVCAIVSTVCVHGLFMFALSNRSCCVLGPSFVIAVQIQYTVMEKKKAIPEPFFLWDMRTLFQMVDVMSWWPLDLSPLTEGRTFLLYQANATNTSDWVIFLMLAALLSFDPFIEISLNPLTARTQPLSQAWMHTHTHADTHDVIVHSTPFISRCVDLVSLEVSDAGLI